MAVYTGNVTHPEIGWQRFGRSRFVSVKTLFTVVARPRNDARRVTFSIDYSYHGLTDPYAVGGDEHSCKQRCYWLQETSMKESCAQPPTLDEVRAAVRSTCRGYPVRNVQIFGSLARGEGHAGSDVDLLVDLLPGSRMGLFEMGALKEDLEEKLGCPVDFVSRKAIERSTNIERRRSILAAPVTIYAR